MTKYCLYGLIFMAALASPLHATPLSVTINDQYWGSDGHGYGDVVGTSFFDIAKLQVTISGDMLGVKVYTNFKEGDPRSFGFRYGDLFISTDGWRPHGSASEKYRNDNHSNGEDWEFVFDTSEGKLYTGMFTTLLSDDLIPSGYVFRNGQEVRRGSGGLLVGAQLPIQYSTDTYNGQPINTINYQMSLASLGVSGGDTLGFKWGMYCANDTIEGSVTLPFQHVPEPGALALLLPGLLALRLTRRRR